MNNPKINKYGSKAWYDDQDQYHNDNGPAIIHSSGYKAWYVNGIRHNDNGPAAIWPNGKKHWYINGIRLTEE